MYYESEFLAVLSSSRHKSDPNSVSRRLKLVFMIQQQNLLPNLFTTELHMLVLKAVVDSSWFFKQFLQQFNQTCITALKDLLRIKTWTLHRGEARRLKTQMSKVHRKDAFKWRLNEQESWLTGGVLILKLWWHRRGQGIPEAKRGWCMFGLIWLTNCPRNTIRNLLKFAQSAPNFVNWGCSESFSFPMDRLQAGSKQSSPGQIRFSRVLMYVDIEEPAFSHGFLYSFKFMLATEDEFNIVTKISL